MKDKWFMLSLLPILIIDIFIGWNNINMLRFNTIYWSIISYILIWIILHYSYLIRSKND